MSVPLSSPSINTRPVPVVFIPIFWNKESKESKVKRVVKAASAEKKTRPPSSERLLKIAGVLDGWDVHTEDIDLDVELFEDDDMKRTREAREISKKHRW